jgi:hypothetical protein
LQFLFQTNKFLARASPTLDAVHAVWLAEGCGHPPINLRGIVSLPAAPRGKEGASGRTLFTSLFRGNLAAPEFKFYAAALAQEFQLSSLQFFSL